ncbi:MAG: DNA-processing protein DprA [Desulfobacterales bacterium]|jgi:DNA processing protein|nr:DNA-processing protein DprA [Desulfobacteraceae bacterium]MDD3991093.1 DNA-processing protein DprA [Desulfobacteraceae bacterium]MDY0310692.1 DNA-processing protein DprA [Desulfobacterales bacterium]
MERLLPWFTLAGVRGIGAHLFKRLIETFGAPEAVLGAGVESLCQRAGISVSLANAIVGHQLPRGVRTDLAAARTAGVKIITYNDAIYPALLRQIPDPPPLLYVRGQLAAAGPAIAIVGARNATEYGLTTARDLASHLALRGIIVVSGLALGIDTAAHLGALDGNGATVAVLGSGLGRIYPAENRKLARRIAATGAVVSELPMQAGPDAHHFPRRNRIISGMSLGTVVVEASRRSGALITARMAADQNREVFAVPGSVGSLKSAGSHQLIRQGAKLVERVEDILEEFPAAVLAGNEDNIKTPGQNSVKTPTAVISSEAHQVLSAMDVYPVHIDVLARKLQLPPGILAGLLLELELAGVIVQWPGKRFARKP